MLRFVIGALGVWLAVSGCSSASVRSQEGHACSTNSSDDPQLICTPAQDLVCIHTYSRIVTNAKEAMKFDGGIRPVYVCRWACNTTAECPQPGDICCNGTIYGKTYNKTGGCVPPGSCDSIEEPDAGAPADTSPAADTNRPADATVAAPDAPADTAAGPAADTATSVADSAVGS